MQTGIPWLDKTLSVCVAVGIVCSLLSHFVPPTTIFGKAVSWCALNFGKTLVKQDESRLP